MKISNQILLLTSIASAGTSRDTVFIDYHCLRSLLVVGLLLLEFTEPSFTMTSLQRRCENRVCERVNIAFLSFLAIKIHQNFVFGYGLVDKINCIINKFIDLLIH